MSDEVAAIVTGGASGIGAATVERLVSDGSYDFVAVLDIDAAVKDIYSDTPSVRAYEADVSDFDRTHEVVASVERDADVEALVNCAGVSRYYWIGDLGPQEWREVIDVNLTSQYNLTHAVAPRQYERGRGYIVNVSSNAGLFGSSSGGVHYSAAKAGIFGLTKGLAKQLAPHVRVNCVVPGLIDTPLATDSDLWTDDKLERAAENIPLGKLGDPDAVARVIQFLCGPGAEYMTGSTVTVDGGSSLT